MKLGRIDFETTANIGIIEGGKATNIVPDKLFLKGEARSHKMSKLEKQVSSMILALKRAVKKNGAKAKVDTQKMYDHFAISPKDEIVKKLSVIYKKLGISPKFVQTGGGSDANIFNAIGVKSIILGVGATNLHSNKEKIRIADLLKAVE